MVIFIIEIKMKNTSRREIIVNIVDLLEYVATVL